MITGDASSLQKLEELLRAIGQMWADDSTHDDVMDLADEVELLVQKDADVG